MVGGNMKRRAFVSVLLVGLASGAGCVESDTQPDQVPVWINNQTGAIQTGEVEWTEDGTSNQLLAAEFEVQPDDEASFYADGITEGGEYTVAISVGDTREEASITGGNLREVDVTIRSGGRIQIEAVST